MDDFILSSFRLSELKSMIDESILKALQSDTHKSAPEYLSMKAACEMLSLTRQTLNEYHRKGMFKKYRVQGTVRLLKSELLEMLVPE